jgi:hypothetical protein
MHPNIRILEVIDSDRPHILSTLVVREGSKPERWGVCRERAESIRPFVGRLLSRAQFDQLLSARLEIAE